jgi:hypothetical protein
MATITETEICKMRREYGLPCSGCVYSDTCEKKQVALVSTKKENDYDKMGNHKAVNRTGSN